MDWYYVQDGTRCGPVSADELGRLADQGLLRELTLVWREGLPAWEALGTLLLKPVGLPLHACDHCGQVLSEQRLVQVVDQWSCNRCKPVVVQQLVEHGHHQTGIYAGFWWRTLAMLIDSVIVSIANQAVSMVMVVLASGVIAGAGGANSMMLNLLLPLLALVVGIGLDAAYNIIFVVRYTATPGKMICRLRIVRADDGKIGWGLATGRYFARLLSSIVLCIGYLMVAYDSEKRGLHDHLCGTRVIRL